MRITPGGGLPASEKLVRPICVVARVGEPLMLPAVRMSYELCVAALRRFRTMLPPPSVAVPLTAIESLLAPLMVRSEEHTSELQSHSDLVCRLLLEKKKSAMIATTMSHLRYTTSSDFMMV